MGRLATTRRFAGIWVGKWCAPRVGSVLESEFGGERPIANIGDINGS